MYECYVDYISKTKERVMSFTEYFSGVIYLLEQSQAFNFISRLRPASER